MALTLYQYASYLDTRADLAWPAPPEVDRPHVKPHLVRLSGVRAVTWSVYGTLLAVTGGDLLFEHPNAFVMQVALDKTIQEFKMWASMTRKPGQPADYLRQLYLDSLKEQRIVGAPGTKHPEILAERIWEGLLKKLLQKDYRFDAAFYGALNEYSGKVAYFFHTSLQGSACYPGAAATLRGLAGAGLAQGLLADGQCFTPAQLQRGLARQDPAAELDVLVDPGLRFLSCDVRARKPSERLFHQALAALEARGLAPEQVLHVGASVPLDVVPARRFGLRTALFAGDRASLQANPAQMRDASSRPDLLLTELGQINEAVG